PWGRTVMGIYDREYYRKEGPSFLDSFTTRGQVCKWLVLVNIAVWVLQLLSRQRVPLLGERFLPAIWMEGPFTSALILDAAKVFDGQVWRLVTYAFLHDPGVASSPGGFYWHIIFNMWFLWLFGGYVEERYGSKEFLAFYLLAALAGGITYTLGWKAGLN